jgi:hypothetical protein
MEDRTEINIEEKRKNDSLEWAKRPREEVEKIKEKAKKEGLDEKRLLLGYVLNIIVNDDVNSFNFISFIGRKGYQKGDVGRSKMMILERMRWEIEFPQTPEELKVQLKIVEEKLTKKDWKGEVEYREAYSLWKDDVKEWTTRFKNTHPEFNKAYEEYIETFEIRGLKGETRS